MQNLYIVLFFVFANVLLTQTPISGIINQYTTVTGIDYCSGKITVADASDFTAGMSVLIIQMQGAAINESDNSSFGNITNIASAGLYEIATIQEISGNDLSVTNLLVNQYDTNGALQIISFPEYENAIVTDLLTAKKWDGITGGVLAFEVTNTLTINADITVNGLGFRGGARNQVVSDCGFLTNANDYFYSANNWRGAPKGEGVAKLINGKEIGRGAQANGGGGGNDHNTGGGGGANVRNGGIGGEQNPGSLFGCSGEHPGRGGKAITEIINRVYLGGGGGAGHTDNNGAGSGGGDGGGIIMLKANTILSNGANIMADGISVPFANGDGGGGGGAGGTIIIDYSTITNDIMVAANGGNGGSINNPSDRCFGPGGGGSGGRILATNSITNTDVVAGAAGQNSTNASACSGLSNGASVGEEGSKETFTGFPEGDTEFTPLTILIQPSIMSLCLGDVLDLSVLAQGNQLSYQWEINFGFGFQDLNDDSEIMGATTNNLTIMNIGNSYQDAIIQVSLTDDCGSNIESQSVTINLEAMPMANFQFMDAGNGSFAFTNTSTNAISYVWDFGDGNTSTEVEPTHIFNGTGTFEVTLLATNACGMTEISQTIQIGALPMANFTANITGDCAPSAVQFSDLSTGDIQQWDWSFPGGTPANSTEQNPLIFYNNAGTYDASLIVTNDLGKDTIVFPNLINLVAAPSASFEFTAEGKEVSFQNTSMGGIFYSWNFGDGSPISNEENPVHTYESDGIFDVTLTVSTMTCSNAISTVVSINTVSTYENLLNDAIGIFPNPTQDLLNIELPKSIAFINLFIFDVQGKQIYQASFEHKQAISLDASAFTNGIYWLEMKMGNELIRKKFIKH